MEDGELHDIPMTNGTNGPNPFNGIERSFNATLPQVTTEDFQKALLTGGPVALYHGVETENATAWLEDRGKLDQLRELKMMALGNARLLYGSDRNRFHDIVNTHFEVAGKVNYAALLIITVEGVTKALRKEYANCPVAATRALVAGLIRDTGLLFTKFDVGDKFSGQQGITNDNGRFELFDDRTAASSFGRYDDTRDMGRPMAVPRGPRGGESYRPAKRGKVLDY